MSPPSASGAAESSISLSKLEERLHFQMWLNLGVFALRQKPFNPEFTRHRDFIAQNQYILRAPWAYVWFVFNDA